MSLKIPSIIDIEQVDAQALRRVMRRVASPVTVVTARGTTEARGTTIGSFTSVSLKPPLISFNVERASQMHVVLGEASRFAVHLLGDEHAWLSRHFAVPDRSGAQQLASVSHGVDAHHTPILDDAMVVIHCRPYATYEAGDHSIVVGEVVALEQRAEGAPLLYYNRRYHTVRQPALTP